MSHILNNVNQKFMFSTWNKKAFSDKIKPGKGVPAIFILPLLLFFNSFRSEASGRSPDEAAEYTGGISSLSDVITPVVTEI